MNKFRKVGNKYQAVRDALNRDSLVYLFDGIIDYINDVGDNNKYAEKDALDEMFAVVNLTTYQKTKMIDYFGVS